VKLTNLNSNIALDIFDPTEKIALHSGTLSTFCVVND